MWSKNIFGILLWDRLVKSHKTLFLPFSIQQDILNHTIFVVKRYFWNTSPGQACQVQQTNIYPYPTRYSQSYNYCGWKIFLEHFFQTSFQVSRINIYPFLFSNMFSTLQYLWIYTIFLEHFFRTSFQVLKTWFLPHTGTHTSNNKR